jgi:F-type H+-transporting ATPase subunit alpha
MKKVAGTLRLDLAQYREKQAFAQFGSDLDASTKAQLHRGERLVEVLKQPQYAPMPVELQVLSIFAANEGFLDELDLKEIAEYEAQMHGYLKQNAAEVLGAIRQSGQLADAQADKLRELLEKFTAEFLETSAAKREATRAA